jgi:hypothetical protein
MSHYTAPRLKPAVQAQLDRGEFDFLMPVKKRLLRTDEVAEIIGRGQHYVRALIEQGRLEVHGDSAFGQRKSSLITSRSVLLYLVSIANYDPNYSVIQVEIICKTFKPAQLDRLIAFATRQKNLL